MCHLSCHRIANPVRRKESASSHEVERICYVAVVPLGDISYLCRQNRTNCDRSADAIEWVAIYAAYFYSLISINLKQIIIYMNKLLKIKLLLLALFVQTTAYANDAREKEIDRIVEQTEEYIYERVEEVVDDRYDWISSPRVWWDVIVSGDNTRKKNWTEHFEENGISKDGIQRFINEQVDAYNSEHIQKLKQACLSEINVVDDASFEQIVKRERYELYCWLGTFLFGIILIIVFALIATALNLDGEVPLILTLLLNLAALIFIIYLAFRFITPLEMDITNSITENIFQQLSNMNIFEQL